MHGWVLAIALAAASGADQESPLLEVDDEQPAPRQEELKKAAPAADPLARTAEPPAGLVGGPGLRHVFPDFGPAFEELVQAKGSCGSWDATALLRRAYLSAPASVFVFPRVDYDNPSVNRFALKKDEAVVALGHPYDRADSNEKVDVVTAAGWVAQIERGMLTRKPPPKPFLPAQHPLALNPKQFLLDERELSCAVPKEVREELAEDVRQVLAERNATDRCVTEFLMANDKTAAGAGNYDVVSKQGGRVVKVENLRNRLVAQGWSKCKGPAIEKKQAAMAAKINASWQKGWPEQLAAAKKRLNELSGKRK